MNIVLLTAHPLVYFLVKIIFVMSVCLSASNNSFPTGQIFMKIDV